MNGRPLSDPDLTNWFSFKVSMDGGKGSFKQEENGEPDALFLNDGNGRFSPMSWTGGAFLNEFDRPLEASPFDWGLSVMMRDLNGDRRPDIFVCNDFKSPDRIWLNQGNEIQSGGCERPSPPQSLLNGCRCRRRQPGWS